MKNSLSPKLVSFANKVAKIPFAKTILKPFYYPYKRRLEKKRNQVFRENALDVLKVFDQCLTDNGFNYILIFGTLLGAIREKGFIKHDADIDTAMWIDNYNENLHTVLLKAGFEFEYKFEVEGGKLAREVTYVKNDVSIDIFFIYPPIDEYPYISSKWEPVDGYATKEESMKKAGYITGKRLELPLTKEVIRMPFESLLLPVPKNAEEVLEFYYGKDYMNPNPHWFESDVFKYRKPWGKEHPAVFSREY